MKWKKMANCGSFVIHCPVNESETTGNVKIIAHNDGLYQVSADSDLFDLMLKDKTIFSTFGEAKKYAEGKVELYRKIVTIYRNLIMGKKYVELLPKVFVQEDLWKTVLSFGHDLDGTPIWCWCHYGSSAEKATLESLEWLIRVIFRTTPEEFEKTYKLQ